jgi:Tol biopolymer transport system component
MALAHGTKIGPYEITGLLGAGGMGEVYRATDTNLKRAVAIKVLPESVANDAERLARFQREAEVLASLSHPNIAHIHGLEKSAGATALVMELVDGATLEDMIGPARGRTGPIQISDALAIARQIADALEAAHEHGIIHRDLKPANVKVKPDGTVKVLDFGLAKVLEPAASSASPADSLTITSPAMTAHGTILGTAAYMSPEQASGKPVDKRSDIWSFGVVLWEMLAGRRLFDAETVSHTLADVLRAPIDFAQVRPDTPQTIRTMVARCLNRDVRKRLRDIGEARLLLDDALGGAHDEAASVPSTVRSAPPIRSGSRERLAWGAAVAMTLVAAGAIARTLRPSAMPPETRLEIVTPATDDPVAFAISPDGRRLVFVASATAGSSQLWLRPLDQTDAQPLAGTEGATNPFWSPDSQSLAFFTGTQLKRIDIGGGAPRVLANTGSARPNGTWSSDGVILFAREAGVMSRVSANATGAVPAAATTLAPGQTGHRFPHFLPDSRQFLFYGRGPSPGLYLASLDSPDIQRVADADGGAMFMPPDWLAFVRQGTLLVQRFDRVKGELTGNPIPLATNVTLTLNGVAFSASRTGVIAYRTGGATLTQLTWFDRSGKAVGTIGQPDANGLEQAMLSPDGRRVAGYRSVDNNVDIWLSDATRTTKLTTNESRDTYPVWSPDGSRIAFTRNPGAKGMQDIYVKPASGGAGQQEQVLLAAPPSGLAAMSWSRKGFLLYMERNPDSAGDVSVLALDGERKTSAFLNSKAEERTPQFSPDGQWVAYASNESGRLEIYLRRFPASSGQWPVSTDGGVTPRWRYDGGELYYVAPDATMMAVSVTMKNGEPELGTALPLFQTKILYGGTSPVGTNWQFDVAQDGRFLINVDTTAGSTSPITVIQNWSTKE